MYMRINKTTIYLYNAQLVYLHYMEENLIKKYFLNLFLKQELDFKYFLLNSDSSCNS